MRLPDIPHLANSRHDKYDLAARRVLSRGLASNALQRLVDFSPSPDNHLEMARKYGELGCAIGMVRIDEYLADRHDEQNT